MAREGRARAEWIATIVLAAVALRYWLLFFNRSTNLLDEGSQAAQALRLLNGEVIYRDFFTVVTPGSYYTVAWLFQWFGAELLVMRWAVLAFGLGILLATLVAARQLMAWPFAAAAAMMTTVWGWFLVAPNFYSWEAAFFVLAALVCYLRFAATGRSAWIVLAGVTCGITILVKQNVGVYAAAALLLSIWLSMAFDHERHVRGRLHASARLAGGVALAVLPVLVFLIVKGAGPYLYESWIYYPLAKYPPRFAVPYPPFYPLLPELQLTTLRDVWTAWSAGSLPEASQYEVVTRLVIYLPVFAYPVAIVALAVHAFHFRRGRVEAGRHGHALLAVTVVGALTLLQSWPRADVTHILFGMQPTFVLVAYACWSAWKGLTRLPGPRRLVVAAALVLTMAPQAALLWYGYQRTHWEYQNYIVALKVDRGRGIFTSGIEAERINKMTSFLVHNTAPDDPIFVVPWAAGFYFLAGRSNPTRTDFMLFEDPEAYPCILSRLDQNPPKYVVYGYVWDVDGRHFRDYARPIDEYIRTRYVLDDSVDGYEAWKRIGGAERRTGEWPAACQPRRFRLRDFQ